MCRTKLFISTKDGVVMFTEKAIAYINSQRLLRVATVSANNQPDNTVTGFEFDGEYFYLGSSGDLRGTRRGKNVLNGNTKVAFIIDDREDIDDEDFSVRYIRVYGTAEFVERVWGGSITQSSQMRITPTVSWSWGIESPVTKSNETNPSPIKTVHG